MNKQNRSTTMVEIAYAAGVSATTVSRVLSDHPSVSNQTREKVLNAISLHGYRINKHARNLRRGETRSLAVIFSEVMTPNHQSTEILSILNELVRISSYDDYELRLIYVRDIAQANWDQIAEEVDGVFLFETSYLPRQYRSFDALQEKTHNEIEIVSIRLNEGRLQEVSGGNTRIDTSTAEARAHRAMERMCSQLQKEAC